MPSHLIPAQPFLPDLYLLNRSFATRETIHWHTGSPVHPLTLYSLAATDYPLTRFPAGSGQARASGSAEERVVGEQIAREVPKKLVAVIEEAFE